MGLTWTLEHYGDALERESAEFVRVQLPLYEKVWASFIGNKGDAQPAEFHLDGSSSSGASDELLKTRQRFAQYHYSVLESLWGMKRLNERLKSTSYQQAPTSIVDDVLLFHAHLGRVRDCISRAAAVLGCHYDEVGQLESQYHQRSVVLHGPHLPSATDELGIVFIVPPKNDVAPSDSGWDDRRDSWIDKRAALGDTTLVDYFEQELKTALDRANVYEGKFLKCVVNLMCNAGLTLQPPCAAPGSPEYVAGYPRDALSGDASSTTTSSGRSSVLTSFVS